MKKDVEWLEYCERRSKERLKNEKYFKKEKVGNKDSKDSNK